MSDEIKLRHNIIIENRKKTVISGVKDVIGFDNESIELVTEMGNLTVRGTDLKMNGFSTEKGNLEIDGLIVAFVYTTDQKKAGLISRIFK